MTQTFREMPGFTTTDGHRYVSVPVKPVPTYDNWLRWCDEDGTINYSSGDYLINRESLRGHRPVFRLYRQVDDRNVPIGFLHSRLSEAQASAVRNARGEHVVNWA